MHFDKSFIICIDQYFSVSWIKNTSMKKGAICAYIQKPLLKGLARQTFLLAIKSVN